MSILDSVDHANIANCMREMLAILQGDPQRIPDTVWHYTDAKGFLGILADKTIRASHIATMNDAFEYRHSLRVFRKFSDEYIHWRQDGLTPLEPITDFLINSIAGNPDIFQLADIPNIYVSCFSLTVDRATHWGEYGDKGRGYALGFNARTLQSIANEQHLSMFPCVYWANEARGIIRFTLGQIESALYQARERHPGSDSDMLVQELQAYLEHQLSYFAPAFKDESFSAETEWRLSRRLDNYSTDGLTFTARGSEILPYYEIALTPKLRRNDLIPLDRVIIGPARPEIDKEIARISVRAMLNQRGYMNTLVESSRSGYRG
jgi:hypothetical protein